MATQNETQTDQEERTHAEVEEVELTQDGRRIMFPQYSKWIDQDRRLFVILDLWHGLKDYVDILNLRTEQKLRRPTAELQRLVADGKLRRF